MKRTLGVIGLGLLALPALILLGTTGSSRAQGNPTPNATAAYELTRVANLSDNLPGAQGNLEAARQRQQQASQDAANQQATLSAIQADINAANARANASLGQQALDAAGQAQQGVTQMQGSLSEDQARRDSTMATLEAAAAAYPTSVAEIKATSEAGVQAAINSVSDEVALLRNSNERKQDALDSREQEVNLYRLAIGFLSLTVILLGAREWRRTHEHRAAAATGKPPVPDADFAPEDFPSGVKSPGRDEALPNRERVPPGPIEIDSRPANEDDDLISRIKQFNEKP